MADDDEDRPFIRDYSHLWRLPPPLPPGDAFYQGLAGLVFIGGLAVLLLIGSAFGEGPTTDVAVPHR